MKNFSIFLAMLTVFACSGVHIKDVKHDNNFKLSNYKTFNFFQVEASGDALGENYLTHLDLLKKSIIRQLEAKGLKPASADIELMINIGIVVTQEVQTRETNFRERPAYMGTRNYSWSSQEVVVGTYKQGSVTIDLVDRASGKLVWQGTAESVVPEKQRNIPAVIEEAMKKLFEDLE